MLWQYFSISMRVLTRLCVARRTRRCGLIETCLTAGGIASSAAGVCHYQYHYHQQQQQKHQSINQSINIRLIEVVRHNLNH